MYVLQKQIQNISPAMKKNIKAQNITSALEFQKPKINIVLYP